MRAELTYGGAFFDSQKDTSFISASIVSPRVLSLCNPKSVADFGCGVGTWVRALLDIGVSDVTGIDGNYVRDDLLVIPSERFVRADIGQPVDLNRKFDLAISMEVAEHLPREKASVFIDTLTKHSGIVLFSAAVPGQGGTYHVNEQWPEYWNELFSARGYRCVDCLRDIATFGKMIASPGGTGRICFCLSPTTLSQNIPNSWWSQPGQERCLWLWFIPGLCASKSG